MPNTIAPFRRPLPGQFGVGTNTEVAQFPTIANTATTTVNIGMTPRLQLFLQGFVSQLTLATSGSALTVTIGKYDSTNSFTKVPLTAATNLLVAAQTAAKTQAIAPLSTLTTAQQTLNVGDSLYADFIAAGTVSAQAVGGIIGAEVDVLV